MCVGNRDNQRPTATEGQYGLLSASLNTLSVMEKKHRVEILQPLLEMHQQQHEPDDEYIKGLRQRLKQAQTQLENMRP